MQAMKLRLTLIGLASAGALPAQSPVNLPEVTVYSPRIANQSAANTFAMPVTALRYEPAVDIHARNFAESQADVTVRGGIFENTGFQVGALTLLDPQTGHYFAELPVAPALLTAPQIATGPALVLSATNATAGAVSYDWRPIRTAGAAAIAFGEDGLQREEIYQGFSTTPRAGGLRFAGDIAIAHSQSDGALPNGEHEFDRVNARLQLASARSQTDLFAGYQAKFFGWPNLYTPFNSNETEDIETTLFALNHRTTYGKEEFFEAGAYHRRNKDDYAFNRFAPVGPVHPFQHTTWISGAALSGRNDFGALALNYRGEVLADEIRSTSLTAGRYRTRTLTKLALVPETRWTLADRSTLIGKLGASFDDTNRDRSAVSPVFSVARLASESALRRVALGYSRSTQVPTYTALNSSAAAGLFRGNANLGRQRSDNVELSAGAAFGAWETEAAAFWRRDGGLVDWTFRRGVTARAANAVDLDVTGLELLVRRSWAAADIVIGYTALSKDADYRGATVDASFYALNYARHRLTAALTWRIVRGLELRFDNVARIQQDNPLRTIGGERAVTSALGLAYRPFATQRFELNARVENLWNTKFQEVPAVPATPRQFSAGVSYAW